MSDVDTTKIQSGASLSADLFLKADTLKKQADRVLDQLDLIEQWSRVGQVVAVGSSRFGLMTSPNLDFEIYVDRPTIEMGFNTIRDLAQRPGVESIVYRNFLGTPDPGLYWRIDYRNADGTLWDIDLWLVPFSHPHAGVAEHFAAAMQSALTETSRRTILEIKAARAELGEFRGVDAYMAVLRDGVAGVAAFKAWLEANPPVFERIETWCP